MVDCVRRALTASQIDRFNQFFLRLLGVNEPIRRPDSVKFPSAFQENLLAKSVAISGGSAGMICLPIALNSQRKKAGVMWMLYGQVDEITGHANLAFGLEPGLLKYRFNLYFKG